MADLFSVGNASGGRTREKPALCWHRPQHPWSLGLGNGWVSGSRHLPKTVSVFVQYDGRGWSGKYFLRLPPVSLTVGWLLLLATS